MRASSKRAARRFRRGPTPSSSCALTRHGVSKGCLPRLRGMFAFALVDFRTRRVHRRARPAGPEAARLRVRRQRIRVRLDRCAACCRGCRATGAGLPPMRSTRISRIATFPRRAPSSPTSRACRTRIGSSYDTGVRARSPCIVLGARRPRPSTTIARSSTKSIELRLVADRPLGLFLSGGVDSTTIACRLAATGHRALHSFSAAFPGSTLDESEDAAATRTRARASRTSASSSRLSIRDDFATIVATLDEPFADPSSFPSVVPRARDRPPRQGRAGR